jgi:hypothetical protein
MLSMSSIVVMWVLSMCGLRRCCLRRVQKYVTALSRSRPRPRPGGTICGGKRPVLLPCRVVSSRVESSRATCAVEKRHNAHYGRSSCMELESCQNPAHTQNVFCSRITIHTHTKRVLLTQNESHTRSVHWKKGFMPHFIWLLFCNSIQINIFCFIFKITFFYFKILWNIDIFN